MTTQLRDTGEEDWPVKLHLGCGGVYLRGYVNCDISGHAANGPPDTATDVTDYYAGLGGDIDNIPARRQTLLDAVCDLRGVDLVADDGTVDKILALQCLEHLPPEDVAVALRSWLRALRPGGVAVVTVPDAEKTLDLMADKAKQPFVARHLLGTHKGPGYWHRSWWTVAKLRKAFARAGFANAKEFPNPHFYPAICMRAWKGNK